MANGFYLPELFVELQSDELIPVTVSLLKRVEGRTVQGCVCLSEGPHAVCGLCGCTVRDSSPTVTQAFPHPAPVKVMNEYDLL